MTAAARSAALTRCTVVAMPTTDLTRATSRPPPKADADAGWCVDDVIITEELDRRPSRAPDHAAENQALTALAEAMSRGPDMLLQRLVELVRELTRADSAGISLIEPGDGETGLVRWAATAGAFAQRRGGTMPRAASPCNLVMERDQLLLLSESERAFPALLEVQPRIHEHLLAPFHIDGRPAGALWAIRHDPAGRFDREDARLLQSLVRFASAAHRMARALDAARVAERQSEKRYHNAIQSMDEAYVLTELSFDEAGGVSDILYVEVNETAKRFIGRDPTGRTLRELSPDYERDWYEIWGRVARTGQGERHQLYAAQEGHWYDFYVFKTQPENHDSHEVVAIIQDISERKEAEEKLRQREERARKTLEIGTVGVIFFDLVGGIHDANDAFLAMVGYSREELEAGKVRYENLTPPDWRWRDEKTVAELKMAGKAGPFEKEYSRKDGSRFWILCASKMLDEREAVEFIVDVTKRKRAEEAQKTLVAELQHRTRNLLAVVSSMARQTIRTSASFAEFEQQFSHRLSALSRVQRLLSTSGGFSVSLRELVTAELTAHGASIDGKRIKVEGPAVSLPSRAVQVLALAVHELTTNAAKYGTLTQEHAGLSVGWELVEEQGRQLVVIRWKETGVDMPKGAWPRSGFGRYLIERALRFELDAETHLDFAADGVGCELKVPLDEECAE